MQQILQTFHSVIPKGKHIYLLIPSSVCKNCYYFDAEGLSSDFIGHFQIISSIDTANFKGFRHTLRDTNDMLVKVAFLDYGIKFVVTDNGEVEGIIPLLNFNRQVDSLDKYFIHSATFLHN